MAGRIEDLVLSSGNVRFAQRATSLNKQRQELLRHSGANKSLNDTETRVPISEQTAAVRQTTNQLGNSLENTFIPNNKSSQLGSSVDILA